ncbi:hypothetical protein B7494_g86 [Chlorociboria aeruginascens]|nr:hypothetical protein B7494_g86 [Chlorociboria aeruginascens]
MPSHIPPSFASAAAGQASGRDSRSGRSDGRGSQDWSRRDPRSINGTVTLRRSSTTPIGQMGSQMDSAVPTLETVVQSQPPVSSYEHPVDLRYSKSQLLDIYKIQKESDAPKREVSRLFADNWDPGHSSNGANGRGWGKSHDGRDAHGPDICWEPNGSVQPISLEEMSLLEKALFAGDVNSPLKPPPQNPNKDQNVQGAGANGRKTSVSHGQGTNTFGLTSPSSSRPGTRRRETTDSNPYSGGLTSPAGTGRFSRDEPSPFFSRKGNDLKDGPDDRAEEAKVNSSPFGGLIRSNTAGSAVGNGPASPWGAVPTSAAMSPMGNFGSFAIGGANPPTTSEKRSGFGSTRGESRLAHLMPRENTEDIPARTAERSWRSRPRTDTDPFGDDGPITGSASLGGGQDISPPSNLQSRVTGLDTPIRGVSSDFGMLEMPQFRDAQQRGQAHQTPQGHEHEPLSPLDTNPYRSPPDEHGERNDNDDDSFDGETLQHSRVLGLASNPDQGPNVHGHLPRGFSSTGFEGSDRSQTSSVGAPKGFPALGGLPSLSGFGALGGWPTSGNQIGTPDRENRPGFPGAFGNSIFGPMGDLQSPSLGGLGNMFGSGSSNNLSGSNTVGRNSKLTSLFPAAMQAQMQGPEGENQNEGGDLRQNSSFGTIGRNAFPSRDTDSPMRTGRNVFEDLFPSAESNRNQNTFSTSDSSQGQTATSFPQAVSTQSNYQQSQASSDSASNQVPTAQQRMMVMPDRMRWVYLDPQGNVQGPWSGLEMHDWYKASFFTPDLSVKKVEDTEFEPLGQLIRRIGNSREPFLVPQIGIPHGPVTVQTSAQFTPAAATTGNPAAQAGSVQPPFAGAFPSFGTTLTAEQQNNLERRKQEEQYLMARQREFLAQQQVNMKQMQMSGLPSTLHHHSSAHSLQSQPSFGSITSPIGMPPQPPLPSGSGFFDGPARQPQATTGVQPDFLREEDLARLSLQDRQQHFAAGPPGPLSTHAQQINAMFTQNPDSQREADRTEQLRQSDPQGFKARLREFEQLRAQHDLEDTTQSANTISDSISPPMQTQPPAYLEKPNIEAEEPSVVEARGILSLTQQVQKAASAKQSPLSTSQPDSPWAKVNASLPMPFPPPPQSTTPLPAPTAQRGRSNLPDALNAEARSRSETPEVAMAPSVAPWAKEPAEAPRGPSLKEIQEAEAKKAAKAEEMAAAARRAAHEQEMKMMMSSQSIAPAPGLPTSSTWGSNATVATPANVPSAWAAKPLAARAPIPTMPTGKKTLAEIQREEESRKQKLVAASAAAAQTSGLSGGKRYADLAGKQTTVPPTSGAAWSTVGAGGKVKIPTGPAATTPPAIRATGSATIVTTTTARAARPAPGRSAITSAQTGVPAANEELIKWTKGALANGMNSDINVDEFVHSLLTDFPPEAGLIADSVYANSQLMDGRRFAEEFLRRRKLAEKGVVEPANVGSGSGFSTAGGWSEVAKKGPPKEEPTAGFKVVPNKKKGKK